MGHHKNKQTNLLQPGVVAQTFNPRCGRQRQPELCDFKARLVYQTSSRTARVVSQRNPIPINKPTNKKLPFTTACFML